MHLITSSRACFRYIPPAKVRRCQGLATGTKRKWAEGFGGASAKRVSGAAPHLPPEWRTAWVISE